MYALFVLGLNTLLVPCLSLGRVADFVFTCGVQAIPDEEEELDEELDEDELDEDELVEVRQEISTHILPSVEQH